MIPSKFAIFLELQKLMFFFRFSFCATLFFSLSRHSLRQKNKVARNEKQKKQIWFFVYINMTNFEAFHLVISSSINLSFLKSVHVQLHSSTKNHSVNGCCAATLMTLQQRPQFLEIGLQQVLDYRDLDYCDPCNTGID